MIRVAVLSPAAELGGAERSLLTFLKVAQGNLVDAVVLLPREGPLGQALQGMGVPWEVVPMPPALLRLSRQKSDRSLGGMLKGLVHSLGYATTMCKLSSDWPLRLSTPTASKATSWGRYFDHGFQGGSSGMCGISGKGVM